MIDFRLWHSVTCSLEEDLSQGPYWEANCNTPVICESRRSLIKEGSGELGNVPTGERKGEVLCCVVLSELFLCWTLPHPETRMLDGAEATV